MKGSVARSGPAITTDRTGGWMKKGFEFEDFVENDEIFFEVRKGEVRKGGEVASRSSITGRFLPVPDVSLNLHRVTDTIVGAFITALDQTALRELVSNRQIYNALIESLRERIWRYDTLPTVASTSVSTAELKRGILQSDSDLEDQLPTSYRHESALVTNAFREMVKGFRPDRKSERPQFVEGTAE